MSRIYVASSWRNKIQPSVVEALREAGHEVYDFKNPHDGYGFHWSFIDPDWKDWTPEKYRDCLLHPMAEKGFNLDIEAMNWADTFVGVQPFGRSASIEMRWAAGQGKHTILLLENGEPELMVKVFDHICLDMAEVLAILDAGKEKRASATFHDREQSLKEVAARVDDAIAPTERTYDCRGLYDQYGQLELENPSASTIEEIADALRKGHPSHQFTVVERPDGVQALDIVANGRKTLLEFLEDDKECACLMTNYCAEEDGICDHVEAGDFQNCERYKAIGTGSAVTLEDVAQVINQPRNPLSVTICKDGGEQEQITFTDLEPNNVTAARINAKLREHGYDASMVAAMTPLSMLESAERRMASAEERCENAQKREQAWVDWFEELREKYRGVDRSLGQGSNAHISWHRLEDTHPWPSLEDERAEAIQDE